MKSGDEGYPLADLPDLQPSRLPQRFEEQAREQLFRVAGHPIIEGYYSLGGWGRRYIEEVMLVLSDGMTPHNEPIPRCV